MSFNSINFLIFFPIVAFIYYSIPHRVRWAWLLIASYYFYASWNPQLLILMVMATIITYLSGILLEKADAIRDKKKSIQLKKLVVLVSLAACLGILFVFKYLNFFSINLMRLFSWLNITMNIPHYDLLLPVGISFYTFKSLSYTIDIYRKDNKAERNLGKYALFVSFFPQLLAGPIEKSKDFLQQFSEKHIFDYDTVKNGLLLMLWGFVQKLVIADRLAILVNTVYDNPSAYRGFEIITASIFFAFQIYCDFSSYSDIAIGAAQVMGFRSTKNFEQPYFSKSIQEFWRRWHITLSSWFKDYLYFPLGGNRSSKSRTYFNIMVVFLVSGLWHGAALNYVIWGGLHGIFQVTGNILKPLKNKIIKTLGIRTEVFSYKLIQVLLTFILVDFAWIFFRAGSFTNAKILILNMYCFNPEIFTEGTIYNLGLDFKDFMVALFGIGAILVINMLQRNKDLCGQLSKQNTVFRWAVYILAVISVLIFGIYGSGFNVQEFIYMQF